MADTGTWIANARMYAVTPGVEAAWRELLRHVADDAQVALAYESYPAPQPLERLWARPDLGAVFMCGLPIASGLAPVVPLAAPVPSLPWAKGRAVYRSDLIVRADASHARLEDTFGGRAGWTVQHSQSGFNAFRYRLLQARTAQRPQLYGHMQGGLVTARRVLDAVREGRLDVGPLDAYWHVLIARHAPELTRGIRVLESTPLTPLPAFVAAAGLDAVRVERLRQAFVAAAQRPWFGSLAEPLMIARFQAVSRADYAPLLEWDRAAREAGYPLPA